MGTYDKSILKKNDLSGKYKKNIPGTFHLRPITKILEPPMNSNVTAIMVSVTLQRKVLVLTFGVLVAQTLSFKHPHMKSDAQDMRSGEPEDRTVLVVLPLMVTQCSLSLQQRFNEMNNENKVMSSLKKRMNLNRTVLRSFVPTRVFERTQNTVFDQWLIIGLLISYSIFSTQAL